jgi:acyl-CoA reductase-like NAD-dependent aldehyde dehydrogenase
MRQARRIAEGMDAGTVLINNGRGLDFDVPFGGLKQSGYGREYGPEGLLAYLESVSIFESF